jgi:hypothetical protein
MPLYGSSLWDYLHLFCKCTYFVQIKNNNNNNTWATCSFPRNYVRVFATKLTQNVHFVGMSFIVWDGKTLLRASNFSKFSGGVGGGGPPQTPPEASRLRCSQSTTIQFSINIHLRDIEREALILSMLSSAIPERAPRCGSCYIGNYP